MPPGASRTDSASSFLHDLAAVRSMLAAATVTRAAFLAGMYHLAAGSSATPSISIR